MKQLTFPEGNYVEKISNEWMLVAAGDTSDWNAMTASWGGVGSLWNKAVAFVFVRPQRHTHGYTEKNGMMTLSFFTEEYRDMLKTAGTVSGRNTDKCAALGLTPYDTHGTVAFCEAKQTLVCRKLYRSELRGDAFTDEALRRTVYPEADYHTVYVAEIIDVIDN